MPHVASSPAFDSSGDLTDSTEQRLDRIRAAEEASEVSGESQTNDGQCFLKALFETAGSITIDGSEPLDRFVDEASCIVVMRLSIRVVQTTTCFALKLLRQIAFHVSNLVKLTSLNDGVVSEDILYRSFQSLRSVETEQRRSSGIDASITKIAQQVGDDLRVLRFALTQPKHVFATGFIDQRGREVSLLNLQYFGEELIVPSGALPLSFQAVCGWMML